MHHYNNRPRNNKRAFEDTLRTRLAHHYQEPISLRIEPHEKGSKIVLSSPHIAIVVVKNFERGNIAAAFDGLIK